MVKFFRRGGVKLPPPRDVMHELLFFSSSGEVLLCPSSELKKLPPLRRRDRSSLFPTGEHVLFSLETAMVFSVAIISRDPPTSAGLPSSRARVALLPGPQRFSSLFEAAGVLPPSKTHEWRRSIFSFSELIESLFLPRRLF